MFELIFGLIWMAIVLPSTILPVYSLIASGDFLEIIPIILFLSMFWAVGIYMIYTGLKQVKKNNDTKIYGEECYARLLNILYTGTRINGVPQVKGDFIVYIPSTGETLDVSEILGLEYSHPYSIGDYVFVKYYNGDINIIEQVSKEMLPYDAQQVLCDSLYDVEEKETILINGVEYVRKDSLKH